MSWSPNQFYRFVLKQGMSGWDVWTIQVSLNSLHFTSSSLTEDGVFGAATANAVRAAQSHLRITTDGICGPDTQQHLCALASQRAEKGRAPAGLLKGICYGESGGIIPATGGLYPNGSRDYGPFQENMTSPSQAELRDAYNISAEAVNVGGQLLSTYESFKGQKGATSVEETWRLAVLNHNWPAAANQIAAGNGNTWVYQSMGHSYKLSDPAPWVEAIGVSGVSTGWQWCEFYINSKITYVTNWSIAQ